MNSYSKGEQLNSFGKEALSSVDLSMPHTTEAAILGGTKLYLKSVFAEIARRYPVDTFVVTGGDGELVSKMLGENLPPERCTYEPHLIHRSLHRVYEVAKENK